MSEIKCFLLEPTEMTYLSLRRYSRVDGGCVGRSYHNGELYLGEFPDKNDVQRPPEDDQRWPKRCDCGYEFKDEDEYQLFSESVWVRRDTNERMSLRKAPAGAMWYAFWLEPHNFPKGPDGRILIVKTPGGEWNVDSRASNCTMKDDDVHRCWCRHGSPPDITVNKSGNTCQAGGGSIMAGSYHGFLTNGILKDC